MTSTGLLRRLAIMTYDTLLVIALVLITTAVVTLFMPGHIIPPHTHWYQALLLTVITLFYTWFWSHGGQTLGMVAWRTRVYAAGDKPPSFGRALLRLILAIPSILLAGIGLWWMLFDKDKLALHDRLSATRLLTSSKRGQV